MTSLGTGAARPAKRGRDRKPPSRDETLVTRALLRAAERLTIADGDLVDILGVSATSLWRLKRGDTVLKETSKEYEIALHVIRLFRGLGAIYGNNTADMARWMHAGNSALDDKPVEILKSLKGLFSVIGYVDAHRAKL